MAFITKNALKIRFILEKHFVITKHTAAKIQLLCPKIDFHENLNIRAKIRSFKVRKYLEYFYFRAKNQDFTFKIVPILIEMQ